MPGINLIGLLAALALPLFALGCGKRAETPAPGPRSEAISAGAQTPAESQLTGTLAPVVIPEAADVNATLGLLSAELRKYVVRTRTAPKNFEEFVVKSNVQAPSAPAGKKYAIQSGSVVLVNR